MQGGSLGCDRPTFGAKIATEDGQGLRVGGSTWHDERIMVPRDCEDGRRVVSEGFVKLIVIILRLPEIINYVAEMKKKCRAIGRIRQCLDDLLSRIGESLISVDERSACSPLCDDAQ